MRMHFYYFSYNCTNVELKLASTAPAILDGVLIIVPMWN